MTLFLDACALIYRFEGAAKFRAAASALIARLTAGQTVVELAVSRLSVLECRVKPLRDGDAALLKRYDNFFSSVHVVELSPAVVDLATDLRVRHGLKTPDALQAACALSLQGDVFFVTADLAFSKISALDVRLIKPAVAATGTAAQGQRMPPTRARKGG